MRYNLIYVRSVLSFTLSTTSKLSNISFNFHPTISLRKCLQFQHITLSFFKDFCDIFKRKVVFFAVEIGARFLQGIFFVYLSDV